ncbi:hypothetical protein ESP51_04900 [Agromyces albus]|uniref:O-antigen ligase-related domain-containing protein n=2 Tax=Agromyces albus TaxID=205332 RepID=A0A4Q2L296_9MICO|nr:hypothetical protein ESP51_04900 [Agromyces albus]
MPRVLVYAAVASAFVTLPSAIPMTYAIGPYSFRLYEPLLIAAAVYVVSAFPATSKVRALEVALFGFVVIWSIVGLTNGSDIAFIIADVRMLVYLALAYSIASRIMRTSMVAGIVRLLLPLLWISAAFTLLGSVAGIPIAGREEYASLSLSADAATRILSPSTYLSVAVVCIAASVVIAGRVPFKRTLPWMIPAIFIAALSFSRNAIISVAVAALVGLIAGGSASTWMRAVSYAAIAVVVGAAAWVLLSATSSLPVSAWALQQVNSFTGRVIEGISLNAISNDTSAQYRLGQENPFLLSSIAQQPVFGHGFGHPYKPLFTGRFASEAEAEALSRFAHNFYLWAWVKAGAVGLVLFLVATVAPAIASMRLRTGAGIGAAAGLLGLLAAAFVAPMPLGVPTGFLVGLLAGACAGLATGSQASGDIELHLGAVAHRTGGSHANA